MSGASSSTLLRFLGNELKIPIVGDGTRDAYLAIRSDDQLENRFAPFVLPAGSPTPRPPRCWPASPRGFSQTTGPAEPFDDSALSARPTSAAGSR